MGLSENVVPLNPMVFMIIIPFLNGYFIGGIPHFHGTSIESMMDDGRPWSTEGAWRAPTDDCGCLGGAKWRDFEASECWYSPIYPLVMTNIAMVFRWPMEIDGYRS